MGARVVGLACVLSVSLSAAALGQFSGGVNVDFNQAAGAGAGQPTILFNGAGGQGGYWNPVNAPFTNGVGRAIRDLGNSVNAVTLTFTSGASTTAFGVNNAQTSGDTELLTDDVLDISNAGNFKELTVGPFVAGVYQVTVYAWDPSSTTNRTGVQVGAASGSLGPSVTVGGAMATPNTLAAGVTHATATVAFATPDSIRIRCSTVTGFGNVNGFQIVPLSTATRLYVDGARPGSDPGDGLSWATSFRDLQSALAVASSTASVSEVWVTRGLYRPDTVLYAAGDPAATFTMRSNLSIYGGFSGTETSLAERTSTGGPATLLAGGFTSRHVVTCAGVTGVLLDSLNVIQGRFPTAAFNQGGAGVFVSAGGLTARHVRFAGNQAQGAGWGGALALWSGSTVVLEDGDAYGNEAASGSFAAVDAGSSLTLRRMSLTSNTSTSTSAGVFDSRGSLTLENSLIANNTHPSWVIDASAGTAFAMRNCTVVNNRSTANAFVGLALPNNADVRNSIVWGNVGTAAPTFTGVVRLASSTSSTTITDSTFQAWDGSLNGPSYANNASDPRFVLFVAPGATSPPNPVSPSIYALMSRSPARDSGYNVVVPAGPDIFSNTRIIDDPLMPNTGFGGGTVDRGCVEMQDPSDACPGDLGSAGGLPGLDGLRDNNDFVAFINYFFASNPHADLGTGGGLPGSDGLYDNNDFIAFINLFFTECP